MMNDRIIKALSGFYYVQTEDGVVECRARGKFRKEGVSPLVGDFVTISRSGKSGTVTEILPRKNSFIRPAVANVDLLVLLAKNKNMAFTREQLLNQVWGSDYLGETRTVDVHIGQLRKKLGLADVIKTIPKIGYRLED